MAVAKMPEIEVDQYKFNGVISSESYIVAMRGLYQGDIHDLTSHDLDYDFEEIDSIKKGYGDENYRKKEVYM